MHSEGSRCHGRRTRARPTSPYKTEIERFQGSLAGLAEIVVFIALGLTIDITHLSSETWLHGRCLRSCSPSLRARSR